MGIGDRLMKVVVKVKDAVEPARRFEASPVEAMREVVRDIRESAARALEQGMEAEEVVSPDGLKALLAFTALRLEYGWMTTPITSNKLTRLKYRERRESELAQVTRMLLN